MIGLPPVDVGAFQESVTLESPALATSPLGAPGAVATVWANGADVDPLKLESPE
jgi:hypothetical protein